MGRALPTILDTLGFILNTVEQTKKDLTRDFALTKQALYHLSHTSSPFCSGYFGDRVS
jgi:hypothetical protein